MKVNPIACGSQKVNSCCKQEDASCLNHAWILGHSLFTKIKAQLLDRSCHKSNTDISAHSLIEIIPHVQSLKKPYKA